MGGARCWMSDLGLLAHRVAVGLFMAGVHGWGKLASFSEKSATFLDPFGIGSQASLGLAVGAEFFCSLLLVVGLGTRLACIPLAITMGVAGFIAHADDPWNKKELAMLYLVSYLVIFLNGPGRLSLDHKLFGPKDGSPGAEGPGSKSVTDPTSTVIRGPVR